MSNFKWGLRSKLRMSPLHPDARRVFDRFITITPVDCTVLEVARSVSRQAQLVKSGASKTMNSRHIPNAKGIVLAADIVPLVNGRVCWSWPVYYETIAAMREASVIENVAMVSGAVWDRTLLELGSDIELEVRNYQARRAAIGKKSFIDGPHNELARSVYL